MVNWLIHGIRGYAQGHLLALLFLTANASALQQQLSKDQSSDTKALLTQAHWEKVNKPRPPTQEGSLLHSIPLWKKASLHMSTSHWKDIPNPLPARK